MERRSGRPSSPSPLRTALYFGPGLKVRRPLHFEHIVRRRPAGQLSAENNVPRSGDMIVWMNRNISNWPRLNGMLRSPHLGPSSRLVELTSIRTPLELGRPAARMWGAGSVHGSSSAAQLIADGRLGRARSQMSEPQ